MSDFIMMDINPVNTIRSGLLFRLILRRFRR